MCDEGRQVPGLDVRQVVAQPRTQPALEAAAEGTGDGSAPSAPITSETITTPHTPAADYPFLHLLDHPATFPVALRALGNPNISLLTSHLICSPPLPPGTGRNIGWHTDGGAPRFAGLDGVRSFQQLKIGYFLVDLLEDDMGSLVVGQPHSLHCAATTTAPLRHRSFGRCE